VRRTLLLLLFVLPQACSSSPSCDRPPPTLKFDTANGTVSLRVETANTPEERAKGLMGRETLPADEGMAFLYDAPTHESFWMKDTLIPLSIAFWDKGERIISILDMSPCTAESCRKYSPGVPFAGAVEVNQGYFADHGIRVGDRVRSVAYACA
jgi:uncharacterized protein